MEEYGGYLTLLLHQSSTTREERGQLRSVQFAWFPGFLL
jgi:hypothetical protein